MDGWRRSWWAGKRAPRGTLMRWAQPQAALVFTLHVKLRISEALGFVPTFFCAPGISGYIRSRVEMYG